MQIISASRLADLLNEGFKGQVKFSGDLCLGIKESLGGIRRFYYGRGNFRLSQHDGKYSLNESQHSLEFKIRRNDPAKYYDEEGREMITVPIDFAENAVLEIERPKDIIF